MTTVPSSRSLHNVYIKDNDCFLEIFRNKKVIYYLIEEDGTSKLLNGFLSKDQKPEIYYLDYLSSQALNKIDILTDNYDIPLLIRNLEDFASQSYRFKFQDFDMDHATLFATIKDSISQLYELTNDQYYNHFKEGLRSFYSEFFYDRRISYSKEDKVIIRTKLEEIINFLKENQSH